MLSRLCEGIRELTIEMMNIRSYSELKRLKTFDERFKYLQLNGEVGKETFGFERFWNQQFYRSKEWRRVRDEIIIRDNGCDLGIDGFGIQGKIMIHHMNPITVRDIAEVSGILLNPEFLICVSHDTHNAIHYGDESLLPQAPIERLPNDTCPWRH